MSYFSNTLVGVGSRDRAYKIGSKPKGVGTQSGMPSNRVSITNKKYSDNGDIAESRDKKEKTFLPSKRAKEPIR